MNKKWVVLGLAAVMLISSAALLNGNPVQADPLLLPPSPPQATDKPDDEAVTVFAPADSVAKLAFSHTGHFYEEAIDVAIITSVPDAAVYYTTDGSEPKAGGERTKLYTEPVSFLMPLARGGMNIVTLKAIAVSGESVSRPLVHTYFLGKDVFDRFDTPVFSLSTNSEYLYDYDSGILVTGRLRDDFIRDNPRKNIEPPDPANFNWRGREGERPIHVEVFEPDGRRVVAQAAGVRVHGGWSRAESQKSLRLIARNEYEPGWGKFHYDFFPGDNIEDGFNTPLVKYDQLVLRNGANDRSFGMLRHEVGSVLARRAGIRASTPVRAAAVFLNGEYHGFAWINVGLNAQYLQDVYQAPARDFQIVGNGERWIATDDPKDRADTEYLNSFYTKDMTDEAVFEEFKSLVDIDDLMLYYAYQTYMGNHDWPNNNLKRWRYTGPWEEGMAPELDGRWRYIIFDLDWTLGLYEDPPNPNKPTFREMMNTGNGRFSHMLNALFARQDMIDLFSLYMCDIAANIVTEENVRAVTQQLYGEALNEIRAAFGAGKYAHWVSEWSVENNHNNMLRVARGRTAYAHKALRDHFGFDEEMFDVTVTGGEAVIGTQTGTSSRYFNHLTVPVKPSLPRYEVFDRWVVNGNTIYDEEIFVSVADARNGTVRLELVTRYEYPPLAFSSAYGSSKENGCVLYNPGQTETRTEGFYLTNDLSNPFQWALPGARVAPGGMLELAGKGSNGPNDLHRIRMGFNARQGRMLYLCGPDGSVIDSITVP
jgi:hypothetical protein